MMPITGTNVTIGIYFLSPLAFSFSVLILSIVEDSFTRNILFVPV